MAKREDIVVSTILDDTMVKLDFGEYGVVEIPPEIALNFVSNQRLRDKIRTQSLLARRKRKSLVDQANLRDERR